MSAPKDYTGIVIGTYTAIQAMPEAGPTPKGIPWLFRCSCSAERITVFSSIKRNNGYCKVCTDPKAYERFFVPGEAAYHKYWANNHYRSGGLSFDDFMSFCTLDCHYCGKPPQLKNPWGETEEEFLRRFGNRDGSTVRWWKGQWILFNGIDKKDPNICDTYENLSNLVPCCKICNFMKGLLGLELFLEHSKNIYFTQLLKSNPAPIYHSFDIYEEG